MLTAEFNAHPDLPPRRWRPAVLLAAVLPGGALPADGQPKRVKILGEDLVFAIAMAGLTDQMPARIAAPTDVRTK